MTSGLALAVPLYEPDLNYLRELLVSAIAQGSSLREISLTLEPCETVLANAVRELVAEFTGLGPRINFVINPRRLGMVANWNVSVRNTRAEYLILAGQDDILAPNATSRHLAALSDGHVVHGSLLRHISASGETLRGDVLGVRPNQLFRGVNGQRYVLPVSTFADLTVCYGNVLGEPIGVGFKRSGFDAVNGFDEQVAHSADVDMWSRLAIHAGCVSITAVELASRRLHSQNATRLHLESGITSIDRRIVFERMAPYVSTRGRLRRGRARLATHDAFDSLRSRRGRIDALGIVMSPSILPFATLEVLEAMGAPATGRRWIRSSN